MFYLNGKWIENTPARLLASEAEMAWIWSEIWNKRKGWGVGQYVLNMDPEKRDILRKLRSDDIQNVRIDVFLGELRQNPRASTLCLRGRT